MVEQRSREQYAVVRQLEARAPAVALAAGLVLLGLRAGIHVRLLGDSLQALAYGSFAFGAVDAAERVLNGLGRRVPRGDDADSVAAAVTPTFDSTRMSTADSP